MKRLTISDIEQSIGAQADFIVEEIIRTGACRREWHRAVSFVVERRVFDMTTLQNFPPRVRRLIDLLSVADLSLPAYMEIGVQTRRHMSFASAA